MLAACLCFKDSAAYLEEWLLFHQVQGIERFYLYDNDSSDDWRSIVAPWTRRGMVETISFPGLGAQTAIYNDCLSRARGHVDWLAFIDDDEFLFPVGNESLADALADYREFAGVAVSWVVFGSNGRERADAEWVLRRFPRSLGCADQHVKCIVRPERVIQSSTAGHMFETIAGYQIVDEHKSPLSLPCHPAPTIDRLRINHYLIKSWEECRQRRGRPRVDTGRVREESERAWRETDHLLSGVDDLGAQRFIPAMLSAREKMRSAVG
jgi:Glycosyltransferase family 92